jgi:hypothetical protein
VGGRLLRDEGREEEEAAVNEMLRLRVLTAKNVIRAAKASGIQLVVSRNHSSVSVVDALGLDGFRIHIIVTCIDVLRHLGTASKELDEIQKELEVTVNGPQSKMQGVSCATCYDTGRIANDLPCSCSLGQAAKAESEEARKREFLDRMNELIRQLGEMVLLARDSNLPKHEVLVQGLSDVLDSFLDSFRGPGEVPKSRYSQCKDCKGTAGTRNGNPGSSWKCCPPLKGPCESYEKEVS